MTAEQLNINEQLDLKLTFGDGFLEYHAGNIISDPNYALIELVANCWDAGADRVDIEWPENGSSYFSVQDNGTGMTYEEFTQRWTQLKYNRLKYQGSNVELKKRPDFVVLPDSSIGTYACDDFDKNHEVNGFRSVFIVELKRGGFKITDKEKNQASQYVKWTPKTKQLERPVKF